VIPKIFFHVGAIGVILGVLDNLIVGEHGSGTHLIAVGAASIAIAGWYRQDDKEEEK
jgi:hypothetical protein